ncbi:MAG TPA: glucose-6-phosphate dehydrogenase [Thermomicrobiales bacterium]|nr:glucose-6-phosphate dehydrogenase [Thermomicrobiales bacterium]
MQTVAANLSNPVLANPLREGLRLEQTPPPCAMVIFGVTGDLTRRKLMPSLYELAVGTPLPAGFSVVGVSHRGWDDATFRKEMRAAVAAGQQEELEDASWESFAQGLCYLRADFNDAAAYRTLAEMLDHLDEERGTAGNRIFYLATSPSYYPAIVQHLGAAGLAHRPQPGEPADGQPWTRIVIEKPFGTDLPSARALNNEIANVFSEAQVYRIDHYLGKETVQNLLVFRFANGIFEPIWNRQYIDHVQVTVAESIGIEGRGKFYEEAGALRDMVQSHMFQLLTLITMEPPSTINAKTVRDEKVQVLQAVSPFRGAAITGDVARGQYGPGWIGGRVVPGYRQEPGVEPDSTVETYVAMKLRIDNWRWAGVPFYLRTGKRLPQRTTEIAIQFNKVPHLLFSRVGTMPPEPNVLTLRIQPDEGISLRFAAKVPGAMMQVRSVNMDFFYGTSFAARGPDDYARLLLDCMLGDSTLFTRRDEVEEAWAIVTPILNAWAAAPPPPDPNYESGAWGPPEADALIERDGRRWRRL